MKNSILATAFAVLFFTYFQPAAAQFYYVEPEVPVFQKFDDIAAEGLLKHVPLEGSKKIFRYANTGNLSLMMHYHSDTTIEIVLYDYGNINGERTREIVIQKKGGQWRFKTPTPIDWEYLHRCIVDALARL